MFCCFRVFLIKSNQIRHGTSKKVKDIHVRLRPSIRSLVLS